MSGDLSTEELIHELVNSLISTKNKILLCIITEGCGLALLLIGHLTRFLLTNDYCQVLHWNHSIYRKKSFFSLPVSLKNQHLRKVVGPNVHIQSIYVLTREAKAANWAIWQKPICKTAN